MKQLVFFSCLLFASISLQAQVNCDAFKYMGDTTKYKACIIAEGRAGHYQFSYEYQHALDRAIEVDSTFSNAYKYKSTAYLKSGDFVNWKKLMDRAVELDPVTHLFYRGWCRFQFFRDYQGAIDDIEWLDSLVDFDIGYGQNGFYHLEITRALCYKGLGEDAQALSIMKAKLSDPDYYAGPFDYIHLGVLYLEKGDLNAAIVALNKQEEINDLAENRFYLAKAFQNQGKKSEAIQNFQKARELYLGDMRMIDPYAPQMDKIYLEEIEAALASVQ